MNIREHPLAWRWTNPQHAVLADSVLAQMQAVGGDEAARLFVQARCFADANGLRRDHLNVMSLRTSALSAEAACLWLRERQPDLSVRAVVLWNECVALRTTWEVFTAHWDDFCYPVSDDVLVWPESERWATLYRHEDEFQFGRRPGC